MKLTSISKSVLLGFILAALLISFNAGAQVTNVQFDTFGASSYRLSWDWPSGLTSADKYLIIYRQGSAETMLPVNGQTYSGGQTFGGGKVLFVIPGTASDGFTPIEGISFSRTTLTDDGIDYWFTIYPYSDSGPTYTTTNPGGVAFITPGIVEEPMMQPSNASHSVGSSNGTSRTITFSYDRSPYELGIPYESRYLVVYKVGSQITYVPTDGSTDVSFGTATLSDGSKGRLDTGTDNETVSIDVTTSEQTVYFKIFSLNKADFDHSTETSSSFNYLTSAPLEFAATIPAEPNAAPTISDETFSIDENSSNGSVVGTVTASDANSDPLTYSITAGNTNTTFAISASSGEITVANSSELDFETTPSYSLTVNASDGILSDNATITIDVNDITENGAPAVDAQMFSVSEHTSAGSIVGNIVASDPENDPLSWSILSGNTNNTFLLNSTTGELQLNGSLDFSTTPYYMLEIEVSDGNQSTLATITIDVNDPANNTAPVVEDQSFSLDENTVIQTSIGSVIATDQDDDPLTYSIVSGNTDGAFLLEASTGEITVENASAIDFETNSSFSLLLSVTDGALSDVATITINLLDIAEAPLFSDQVFTLEENSENGTSVGTVSATDPENEPLTFVIESGNEAGAFLLVSGTGELLVVNSSLLDFESTPYFELNLSVSDGTNATTAMVTVELTEAEETVLGTDLNEASISFYPNPATTHISINQDYQIEQIHIRDQGGKLVERFAGNSINKYPVNQLKTGMYHIIIHSKGEVLRSKLIIK